MQVPETRLRPVTPLFVKMAAAVAKVDGMDAPIGIDLPLLKAKYKALNIDYFRKPMTESCPCDSSTDTRNKTVSTFEVPVQKMTREPFIANTSDEAFAFGAQDVLMSGVTPLFVETAVGVTAMLIKQRNVHDVVLGGGSTLLKDRFEELSTDHLRNPRIPLRGATAALTISVRMMTFLLKIASRRTLGRNTSASELPSTPQRGIQRHATAQLC